MPKEVEECVESVLDDNPEMDESSAYAVCHSEQKAAEEGIRDLSAVRSVARKKVTGEWSGDHAALAQKSGREHLLETYGGFVDKALAELREETTVKFKAELNASEGMTVLFKQDDGKMLIWGPASVEVVDKEKDRITTEALKEALPQLMRRQRLSLQHSDQLVGDIKEAHEFEEPKTLTIDGHEFSAKRFPTEVLHSDEDGVPHDGLYVAGEVWSDTRQAQETQEKVDDGTIDSYSISGEAIESSTRVKDGELVDDIKSIDLSAVTLCENGMNQKAKFATLAKSSPETVREAIKESMPDNGDDGDDEPSNASEEAADEMEEEMDKSELHSVIKDAASEVLKERLPDGELATKETVEQHIEEKLSESEETEEKVDPDEIEDPDGDGEEEVDNEGDDEDMPPEEKAVNDVGARIEAAAEELGKDPGELASMLVDGKEDLPLDEEEEEMPDDDEEVEVEVEDDEEEVEMSTGHDVSLDTLKSELPDDLYSKVAEHLADPGDGQVGKDGEEDEGVEKSEEDGEEPEEFLKAGDGDMDSPATSAGFDAYVDGISGSSVPTPDEDQDLEKSFEGDETIDEENGMNLADDFYEGGI